MKEGLFMRHCNNNTTRIRIGSSLIKALGNSLAIIGCLYLYYYFMHTNPVGNIAASHGLAFASCFIAGFNLRRTINSWKQWVSEHKASVKSDNN